MVNGYLTTFYWDRAYSWLRGATGTDWKDWIGRSVDWTGSPLRSGEKECLEAITVDSDGYVWTWNPPGSRGWPFPSPSEFDTRHFTTNAMYILGIYHYFSWTKDREFLQAMLPKAQLAMEYYLSHLGGSSGLVTINVPLPAPDHTAFDGAVGVNYWDITAHGWTDAYTNAYFYAASVALAELEEVAGQEQNSQYHRGIAEKIRTRYQRAFWNAAAGRFVQAIDEKGQIHDHGAVYVNLEAVFLGLATDEQARAIFHWLDNGQTQLTTLITFNPSGGTPVQCPSGGTLGQSFTANAPFAQVAGQFPTWATTHSGMTLTLYRGSPSGPVVAQKVYQNWGDGGWAPLSFDPQPPGNYYLELSNPVGTIGWWGSSSSTPAGQAYENGTALTNPAAFSLAVLSPYQAGPRDIYSQWKWAPRTTTHKNNFWYVWLWAGVTVPWGSQLQDGGADLYMVGFDVMARARYLGADNAWERMQAVLERYSLPDRLCGGSPLYLGEIPQNEVSSGSVGVDVPFPESGLAPASFVYAFIGLRATPKGLYIKPNLPVDIDWVEVTGVNYRGVSLTVHVQRHHIFINGQPGTGHLVTIDGLPGGKFHAQLLPSEERPIWTDS
ncbi:MAG: GH116 family glycosyl hydrolase [Firmicutes bacterium]|nr:GH116 family glycosyl hydrolase [Bacillota bacterium]